MDAALPGLGHLDLFMCERFRCVMRREICVARQTQKRKTATGLLAKYEQCEKCSQGGMMLGEEGKMEKTEIVNKRTCRKCGREKPLDDFSRAASGKYGRKSRCKVCDAEYFKKLWAKKRSRQVKPSPTAPPQFPRSAKSGQFIRALDFGRYPEVLKALDEQATLNIRTAEEQALFYVVAALKKEEAHG